MALLVNCECGHRLEAADAQAGQQVPCPACGKLVQLPEAYNPLSTAKFLPPAGAEPEVVELPRPAGPECEACAGSGLCHYCQGVGKLKQGFFERVNSAIAGAVAGVVGYLSGVLGATPVGSGKKFQTKSEKRRAAACPGCEGSGKCFGCQGSGRASS